MPSLWGALIAGGGKGKTEMIEGFTESVIEVHPSQSSELVARSLADEIRRVTSAQVLVASETASGEPPAWPKEPGDAWHVQCYSRWVCVWMPVGRNRHIPWDIQAGLHLSDDFMFWRWNHSRSRSREPSGL